MNKKVWNKALDRYLTEGVMDSSAYESMTEYEKSVIQEIKRSFKRIITKLCR